MSDEPEFGEIGEALLAVGLGILGGLTLGAILASLTKPKCPVCHQIINQWENPCPHCQTPLRWG